MVGREEISLLVGEPSVITRQLFIWKDHYNFLRGIGRKKIRRGCKLSFWQNLVEKEHTDRRKQKIQSISMVVEKSPKE